MIKKLFHILKGWGKRLGIISVSKAEEKLSALRLSICNDCLYSQPSKLLAVINGDLEETDCLICTKCKCPCLEKSLVVDEECPIRNW